MPETRKRKASSDESASVSPALPQAKRPRRDKQGHKQVGQGQIKSTNGSLPGKKPGKGKEDLRRKSQKQIAKPENKTSPKETEKKKQKQKTGSEKPKTTTGQKTGRTTSGQSGERTSNPAQKLSHRKRSHKAVEGKGHTDKAPKLKDEDKSVYFTKEPKKGSNNRESGCKETGNQSAYFVKQSAEASDKAKLISDLLKAEHTIKLTEPDSDFDYETSTKQMRTPKSRPRPAKSKSSQKTRVGDKSMGTPVKTEVKKENIEVLPCSPGSSTRQLAQHSEEAGGLKSDSDSESDWEEVEDVHVGEVTPLKSQLPDKPVEITIDAPDLMRKKRKKKSFDIQAWFNRKMNRYTKELQITKHKVHLLCLLSHGFHRNSLCNNAILHAAALSITPPEISDRSACRYDMNFLGKIIKWFTGAIVIDAQLQENKKNMYKALVSRFEQHKVASETELVLMFVIILRTLGAETRLVISLQPMTHKPTSKFTGFKKRHRSKDQDDDSSVQEISPDEDSNFKLSGTNNSKPKQKADQNGKAKDSIKKSDHATKKTGNKTDAKSTKPGQHKHDDVKAGTSQSFTRKTVAAEPSSKDQSKGLKGKKNLSKSSTQTPKNKNRQTRTCASKLSSKSYQVDLSSEGSDSDDEPVSSTAKKKPAKRKTERRVSEETVELSDDDSDFEVELVTYRKSPSASSSTKGRKKTKVVSSDSDDSVQVTKTSIKDQGTDIWAEVYLQAEEKWICVDCVRGQVNKIAQIEKHATKPISYVLAYDNRSNVKDVTSRYASDWMSHTRKLRPDTDWWEETLLPYKSLNREKDETENLLLQAMHMRKPLPTSITDYKNHPLYALQRHLLKFEAIYPETALPVGYVKKEPVYARECVHTLHTRETWLKEGRAVRVGESAYKIVKGRKRRRQDAVGNEEPTAELFGLWQTEEYMPPPVVDGKVPRNEYGNVEIFQPWMVPPGSVHLKIPGLNKVAKKLNIDCVPAMVGWDFHGGWNHPVLDGFVVCEEHKDILLAAWDEDQEIQRQRQAEKREKRALDHWKLLVRGLLIKERLKHRFNLVEKNKEPKKSKKGSKAKPEEKATDLALSWPQNKQKEPESASGMDHSHLFPSEEL